MRTVRQWSSTVLTDRHQIGTSDRYRVYALDGSTDRCRTPDAWAIHYKGQRFVETSLFIDRDRYDRDQRYGVWLAGGHRSGCALRVNGTARLADAAAVAIRTLHPAEVS